MEKTSQSEIEVESSYEGLRLNFPIKKKDFHDLVNYLKKDTVRRRNKKALFCQQLIYDFNIVIWKTKETSCKICNPIVRRDNKGLKESQKYKHDYYFHQSYGDW